MDVDRTLEHCKDCLDLAMELADQETNGLCLLVKAEWDREEEGWLIDFYYKEENDVYSWICILNNETLECKKYQ